MCEHVRRLLSVLELPSRIHWKIRKDATSCFVCLIYRGFFLSRTAWAQNRGDRAGQGRLAKAQGVLIKLVSLERAPMGVGRFDNGLI